MRRRWDGQALGSSVTALGTRGPADAHPFGLVGNGGRGMVLGPSTRGPADTGFESGGFGPSGGNRPER